MVSQYWVTEAVERLSDHAAIVHTPVTWVHGPYHWIILQFRYDNLRVVVSTDG
jgi:hypothetical protein